MGRIKTLRELQQERDDNRRYAAGNVVYDNSKLCLIYARQSSSKQYVSNIYSAIEQSEGLLQRASDLGWIRDEQRILYVENQLSKRLRVSGSLRVDQRVGLKALTEVIESGQASAVLVVAVDRITRDPDLITPTAFANLCKQYGVLIITDEYTFDFNNPLRDDMGRFMNEAIAAKEYVRRQVKGKMLKGRSKKASLGRVANGTCPIGLMLDEPESDKTKRGYNYLPSPHAERVDWLYARYRALGANLAKLQREIFDMAKRGEPLFPDAPGIDLPPIYLKRMKGGWTIASLHGLRGILCNPHYAGHIFFDGHPVKLNAHTPIVDPDNWLYAFEHLSPVDLEGHPIEHGPKTVRYEQQSRHNNALLTGTRDDGGPVIDGVNGVHVYVQLSEAKDYGVYYMQNVSPSRETAWGYVSQINTVKLDAIVEDRVLHWLRVSQEAGKHTTYDRAPYKATDAIGDATPRSGSTAMQNDLALTITELAKVERRLRTSEDVMSDSDLRATYEKKARLQRRQTELAREIATESARASKLDEAKAKLPTAATRWAGWSLEERRQFIRLITDSITIEKLPDGDLRLSLVWSQLMGFMYPETSSVRAVDVALIHRHRNLPDRVTWAHDYIHNGYIIEGHRTPSRE